MRVPNLDWAPELFVDELAARQESSDDAVTMRLKPANGCTAAPARPSAADRSPAARLAKAA